MNESNSFADRIRERYPEGLTGIVAIGGTRTTYILDHNHTSADPGRIPDMQDYIDSMLARYLKFASMFFDLGGQNLIMNVLSFRAFYERGKSYADATTQSLIQLIGEHAQAFYRDHEIDLYFAGIDTFLLLPETHAAHQLAVTLKTFQEHWPDKANRRKLVWEIASIPLYSIWQAPFTTRDEDQAALKAELAATEDLETVYRLLYKYYARAVYGTDIPLPHFYLGTNRNGDLKLRAPIPITLASDGPFRLFYTPYPSLYTTRETLQAILEDLAFGKSLSSSRKDYSGQYTSELLEAEYQRVLDLSSDPYSTFGLLRRAAPQDNQ